jgi:CRP/FNR family transcriptional regulator, cyclic AMP receptor protein
METIQAILAKHPFFDHLESRYVDLLAGCASNVVFKPGDAIVRTGEEANHFYLIRQGRVSLEMQMPPRGSIRLQTIEGGDILGWSWLFPPYRWRFDARSLEVTRAIALNGKCLREKSERDHDLGYQLLKRFAAIVDQRLQATRLQLLDMYSVTAPDYHASSRMEKVSGPPAP